MFRDVLTSLAAWHSDITVLPMNEADLHQTQLVLVIRRVTGVSHQTIQKLLKPTQPGSLSHVGAMLNDESINVYCHIDTFYTLPAPKVSFSE